jgi:endonuclease G
MDLTSLRRETRYGVPAADDIIFNRHYVVGYSFYFRQAKWALELVDADSVDVQRHNAFRPDFRLPQAFRADLQDYSRSGFDRGHLVASANKLETEIQNSETFLLSNMAPQAPRFNRDIWRKLESEVRRLDSREKVQETYVVCGPLFDFNRPLQEIGSNDNNGVTIPVPHAFFKCVLTENNNGKLDLWAFAIPNEDTDKPLKDFLVSTSLIERWAGIQLWDRLVGPEIEKKKKTARKRVW